MFSKRCYIHKPAYILRRNSAFFPIHLNFSGTSIFLFIYSPISYGIPNDVPRNPGWETLLYRLYRLYRLHYAAAHRGISIRFPAQVDIYSLYHCAQISPPIQWQAGTLSPEKKRPVCKIHHSPSSSIEVKKKTREAIPPRPHSLHGEVLNLAQQLYTHAEAGCLYSDEKFHYSTTVSWAVINVSEKAAATIFRADF